MKLRNIFYLVALLISPLLAQRARAQNQVNIQPDCFIPFTLTAAGNFPAATANNGPGDNRQKGCAAWTLMYQNTGMTSVSVTLQSGSSVNTTVSFGGFAGTISMGFVNPIVSDTGGSLQAVNGTADISWVRVNVAATGTGTLTGVLYGFRNSSAAVSGGGSSTGPPCGPTVGEVQLYATSTTFGCNTGFTFPTTFGGELILGDTADRFSGPAGFTTRLYVSGNPATPNSGDVVQVNAGNFAPEWVFASSGGTTAVPTDSVNGDFAGTFYGYYFHTGMWVQGPTINIVIDNVATGAAHTEFQMGDLDAIQNFYVGGSGGGTNTVGLHSLGVTHVLEINTGVVGSIATLKSKYESSDGSLGTTGNGFKDGICVTAGGTCVGGSPTIPSTTNFLSGNGSGGVSDSGVSTTDPSFVTVQTTGHAFAGLGTPANGTYEYCSDCTVTSGIDDTCAASGSGAFAQRINGAWKCNI